MHSLKPFLVSFLLAITNQLGQAAETPSVDEDRDAIVNFHDTLSKLAHSLVDVHNDMNNGVPEAEGDVSQLTSAETRMTFEVRVMKVEHDEEVLAGKRSGTDLVERGKKITESETSLSTTLPDAIKNTTDQLANLNETMRSTTLTNDKLADLQAQANANLTGDDQIEIPQTGDIMVKVTSQITAIRPVYERQASSEQYAVIDNQLTLITGYFDDMLSNNEAQDFQQVAELSKRVDVALSQIKQLNIVGTQARMEL